MKRSGVKGGPRGGKAARGAARHLTNMLRCELGELADLSESGMRVMCERKPPVKQGQLVQVTLRSGKHRLPLIGRVAWLRRRGLRSWSLGMAFMNVGASQAASLKSLALYGFIDHGMLEDEDGAGGDNGHGGGTAAAPIATVDLPDYYAILEVERGADEHAIQQAYRALARRYHPDVNQDDAEIAAERFMQVKEAYDILRDPAKRKSYDQSRG